MKISLCAFAFCLAQAPAFSLSREEYVVLAKRSHGDILAGHFDVAMRKLLPLSHSQYADARLFVDLADCYRQEYGQHNMQVAAAKDCCRKAIALDPEFSPTYIMLGQIAAVQGEQDEAVKQYTKALSVKKPDISAWYHRGKSYASLHRYTEAIADLNKGEKLQKLDFPNDHDALINISIIRAQVYHSWGKYDLAIAEYKKSYPKYKTDWTDHQILDCMIKGNKLPEAINELSNRIKTDPQDDQAYFKRAGLELQLKQFKKAIADYTSAIAIDPTSSYFRGRAKAYQEIGETDLSKKDLEKAGIPAR